MIAPLDEIKFLLQVTQDSKRVVMCSPDDQLACEIATAGIPNVTVQVHPYLRKGTVYIVDPNAMEASRREALRELP